MFMRDECACMSSHPPADCHILHASDSLFYMKELWQMTTSAQHYCTSSSAPTHAILCFLIPITTKKGKNAQLYGE